MFAGAENTMKWPHLLAAFLTWTVLPCEGLLNLAAPYPCGQVVTSRRPRVIGGQEASEGQFPWILYDKWCSLRYSGVHYCAGTLLNSRHLLTAAHCFRDRTDTRLWGVNIPNNLTDRPAIDKILIHPDYNWPHLSNDVAVVSLTAEVQWTDYTGPVCLPDSEEKVASQEGEIAGWGNTEAESGENQYNVDDTLMCTGLIEGGRDACKGDSGGALLTQEEDSGRWLEVGIISAGYKCGLPRVPGIYSRVATFSRWVQDQVT